jgi:hypothetical protein
MTVYTGRTFQTCALWFRVFGIRCGILRGKGEIQPGLTAVVADAGKQKESPTPLARGAVKWH